jgi:hypothetical protein
MKKEYIILVLIIILLSVYVVIRKNEKLHYELPEIAPMEKKDITKITIKRVDSEITLSRDGNRWLIKPDNFLADSHVVEKMLDNISGFSLTALVSQSKNYELYELDDENKITVTAYKGDKQLLSFDIGKTAPTARYTFVRLNDNPDIYHAEHNLKSVFNKTVEGLRDRIVMKFSDEIDKVTFIKGKESLKIIRKQAPISEEPEQKEKTKEQQPSQIWQTEDGKPVKDSEIDNLVNTLSNFSCDDFITDRKKEDFTQPIYKISLKGLKTYTISIFKKEDNRYPALSSESEYPFFILEWKAKNLMKDFNELLKTENNKE